VRAVSSGVAPVYGLILAGGVSSRMRRDKAALLYRGKTQLDRAFDLARAHVDQVFVSVRASQAAEPTRSLKPLIVDMADLREGQGPIVGIRSAMAAYPDVGWLVIACDLPFLSDAALEQLLRERDLRALVTAFRSAHDGLPEPLCTIWEPAAAAALSAYQSEGGHCPRKFLRRHQVSLIEPFDRRALDNINTPEEYTAAQAALESRAGESAVSPPPVNCANAD
jgi:molybdopterin-guanine dinucleotide biosynthesis protein A